MKRTPAQVGLSMVERRANVCGAFATRDAAIGQVSFISGGSQAHPIKGQRVLVVDDVCTTGATLEACSLALRAAGASSVWGFTLARA